MRPARLVEIAQEAVLVEGSALLAVTRHLPLMRILDLAPDPLEDQVVIAQQTTVVGDDLVVEPLELPQVPRSVEQGMYAPAIS